MDTISRYWNDMVGGYRWIHQEDCNETFGTDVKSDLTASSSQKSQPWHCYEGNPTKGRIPKRKKTLSGFQRFIEEPQPVNGSGSMTICTTTGLLKTAFLDRLQCWKKTKFWGCSGGILPLGWIPKSWTTLPDFLWLLIQPQRTNGLEDTEFCASVKLLKTELDSTTVGRNKIPDIKQTETPGLPNTISIRSSLCFSMVHFITPND